MSLWVQVWLNIVTARHNNFNTDLCRSYSPTDSRLSSAILCEWNLPRYAQFPCRAYYPCPLHLVVALLWKTHCMQSTEWRHSITIQFYLWAIMWLTALVRLYERGEAEWAELYKCQSTVKLRTIRTNIGSLVTIIYYFRANVIFEFEREWGAKLMSLPNKQTFIVDRSTPPTSQANVAVDFSCLEP